MKKLILLLCLFLTIALPVQADPSGFSRRIIYGSLVDYSNYVYGYAIGIYGKFQMLPDEALAPVWDHLNEDLQNNPEADRVFDLRCWLSPDSRYQFQVQVKEPTYSSFAVELAHAPDYLHVIADQFLPEDELTQLHEGILRDTPEGQMLELAISYLQEDAKKGRSKVVSLYYDHYYDGLEYIFSLLDFGGNYAQAQSLLDEMVQTVQIVPILKEK